MADRANPPILKFRNQASLSEWFGKNSVTSQGFLLKIGKGPFKDQTISYAEALEIAICYGWIDSQKLPFDEHYWLQKFTPRKKDSIWSKVNREKAEKLLKEGKMKPPGIRAMDEAKSNGRWENAYEGQKNMTVPPGLKKELGKNKKAREFFENLNSVNRYAILFRIHSAKKEETRKARINKYMEMLRRGEKIYD